MTDLNALHYTPEHEWISIEGDVATIGITDYAAEKLGDVVFVELPNTKIELLHPLGDASPIKSFLERNPSGGILSSGSVEVIRRHSSLSSGFPGEIGTTPSRSAWANSARSRRRSALRAFGSKPWHAKQFAARIGRIWRL